MQIYTLPVVLREGTWKSPRTSAHMTFVNPSEKFQNYPRCFGFESFKTLKWPPKIKGAREK